MKAHELGTLSGTGGWEKFNTDMVGAWLKVEGVPDGILHFCGLKVFTEGDVEVDLSAWAKEEFQLHEWKAHPVDYARPLGAKPDPICPSGLHEVEPKAGMSLLIVSRAESKEIMGVKAGKVSMRPVGEQTFWKLHVGDAEEE